MVTHRDVAIDFANGIQRKGCNMFSERETDGLLTVYSWGKHFPIACETDITADNGVMIHFFNTESYSSSTSKHQSYVRSALGDDLVIHLIGCEENNAKTQHDCNNQEISTCETKSIRARTESMKDFWNGRKAWLKRQNELIENYLFPRLVANQI